MSTRARRTQPARAGRRDEMRELLLGTIETLVEQGVALADVTVERMAAEAGISRTKFYAYFEDKADLLRAWFELFSQELKSTTEAWWEIDGESSRADLRAAFAPMVATYRPHRTLMAAVHDAALYDLRIRAEYEAFITDHMADLRRHIKLGQRHGFVTADLAPAETAMWLARLGERMQRRIRPDATPDELRRHLDTYTDLVWQSLYADADARREDPA